jgi:hypothetical protein
MITSIYRGGLGNQLFQVVVGYFLAKENNDKYGLNPNLHKEYGQGKHIKDYVDSIFKNIEKTEHESKILYKEPQFNYSGINYSQDLLLDGYFQTEKYFLNKKSEINDLLEFTTDESETNICVIHVRTGDYLYQSNFNIVTPDYFRNAIEYIQNINSDIEFKVISDNNALAARYIPSNIKYEFCSSNELDDLKTLSKCDYAIISNSSFGWWGSYLGKSKITIAPHVWFRVNYDVSDVYRDDMIKIKI